MAGVYCHFAGFRDQIPQSAGAEWNGEHMLLLLSTLYVLASKRKATQQSAPLSD